MIEALIQYIESKGFTVEVSPHELTISKYVKGIGCVLSVWSVSRITLNQIHREAIFAEADRRMEKIETMIKEARKTQEAK